MTAWQTMETAPKDRQILLYCLAPSLNAEGCYGSLYLAEWNTFDWIVGNCEETRYCGDLPINDKPLLWADVEWPENPLDIINDPILTDKVRHNQKVVLSAR